MSKIFFPLAMLLCFHSLLMSQQLRSEKVGENSSLVLLLPYSDFHPNQQTKYCNYDLNVDILDSNKKNIHHEFIKVSFSKPESLDAETYPIFFNLKLNPGSYAFYMKLQNRELGDKNEQKFLFKVSTEGKKIGTVFLVGKIHDSKVWVRDLASMPSSVDSLYLTVNLSVIPDSVKLSVSEGELSKSFNLSAGQFINESIKSNLSGFKDPVIKLQVFAQKIKYTKEVHSYDTGSSFSMHYSTEDQVQQLRYIMNQNELQYIRSVEPEKYKQVIEEFWKMKDPTPDTKRNEFREAFEARVLESDRAFSIRNYRPGWNTDRGKIFIKYGPPDEVVSDAYPQARAPYIIWYYYAENKTFQFNDLDGWGNYQLGTVTDE